MSGARPDLLLAGDVGATKTNLTLYTAADGVLTAVVETHFMNQGRPASGLPGPLPTAAPGCRTSAG